MSFLRPYQYAKGLTILMVCVVGCATPHRRQGFQGDYSTGPFSDNVFKVTLESREAFDRQMGDQLLLRRASQVTLQNGLTHFVVISQDRAAGLGFVARPGIVGPVGQTSQAITIRCYRGTPELAGVIDARQWLRDHPVAPDSDTSPASTP